MKTLPNVRPKSDRHKTRFSLQKKGGLPLGPLVILMFLIAAVLQLDPVLAGTIKWHEYHINPDHQNDVFPLAALPETETGYYFVQFDRSVTKPMKAEIRAKGGVLLQYVPENTYIAKLSSQAQQEIEHLSFVSWVGIYSAGLRLSPSLVERIHKIKSNALKTNSGNTLESKPRDAFPLSSHSILTLSVSTFKGEDSEAVKREIEQAGGRILSAVRGKLQGEAMISMPADRVFELTRIRAIMWIEEYHLPVLFNDTSRDIMDVTPVWTAPENLRGAGQIIAVADTGLDSGVNDGSLHEDFQGQVTRIFSWPVAPTAGYTNVDADDGSADLDSGHGTHVAGTVLGNGSSSALGYGGIAPEAHLVFQAIEQLSEFDLPPELDAMNLDDQDFQLSGIPPDLKTLFQQAYENGARIHTNSWGNPSTPGAYTNMALQADEFVWHHPDMMILFAGGNSGMDGDHDNVVEIDSISSPATAKNVFTVGASENNRPEITQTYQPEIYGDRIDADRMADNTSGMAAFSSRGPTDDGRIKPDIVAPGTMVISTRSQAAPNDIWFEDDMEDGQNGWEVTGVWQLADVDAHSGINSWHVRSGDDGVQTLVSPLIDISTGEAGTKYIQLWCRYDLGDGEQWSLDISSDGGTKWQEWKRFNNTQAQWELLSIPLKTIFLGIPIGFSHVENFRFRFQMESAGTESPGTGAFIDDIRIVEGVFGNSLLSDQGLASVGSVEDQQYVLMSGTSMATPLAAGAAALVRQYYVDILGIDWVSAALLRATLINGAVEMSPGQYGTEEFQEISTRPNNTEGWGRVDVSNTIFPKAPALLSHTDERHGLETGESKTYSLVITNTDAPVVVTMVYHDYPGDGLVNNLDLTVTTPGGNIIYPNGGVNPDTINNVEQISFAPQEVEFGTYLITVKGANIPEGPQPYAVVARGGGRLANGSADLTVSVEGPLKVHPGVEIGGNLTIQVQNVGDTLAIGTLEGDNRGYMVDLVLSSDEDLPSGFAVYSPFFQEDVLLRGGRASRTRTLAPDESAVYSIGAFIPVDTPPGNYCLGVVVDPNKTIPESDETNNTACQWIEVITANTRLASGQTVNGLVNGGEWRFFTVEVPGGEYDLIIELFGLSDDVDLYIKAGSQPTLESYDCRSYLGGTSPETCQMADDSPTIWYIGVYGYQAGNFSLKTIVNPVVINSLITGQAVDGAVDHQSWIYYKVVTFPWEGLSVQLFALSDDVDLYLRYGARPTLSNYDCRPYRGGREMETCEMSSRGAATWFIGVNGYHPGHFSILANRD